MCDCRKDIEAKLVEHYLQKHPTGKHLGARLENYAYGVVANKAVTIPYAPYKVTGIFPNRSGAEKEKTIKGNMHFSFCPYCGTKIDKGQ